MYYGHIMHTTYEQRISNVCLIVTPMTQYLTQSCYLVGTFIQLSLRRGDIVVNEVYPRRDYC